MLDKTLPELDVNKLLKCNRTVSDLISGHIICLENDMIDNSFITENCNGTFR